MAEDLSSSARRVWEALRERGLEARILELPASTRSAREAAEAIGCQVGQIAKSLVFRVVGGERAFLVVASGTNRVDESLLSRRVGEAVEIAQADFVREWTGFAIGGVPPVGHVRRLETYVDEDLLQYEELWAAAGNPQAVFRLTPEDLVGITGGVVVAVK